MKHAYLILAHNDFGILEKLLRLLDDPRNDFYIHIDKKVKRFPFEQFRQIPKHSAVHFVPRVDIRWGDFSMVKSELLLLKAAIKGGYRYYHLLSGVDLPLKSNDEIHSFFEAHDGREFIHFCEDSATKTQGYRIDRYHSMRLFTGSNAFPMRCGRRAVRILLRLLYKVGIRRRKNRGLRMAYGAQWFSITHGFAEHIVAREKWIQKHFRFTYCCDELVVQTLALNSEFGEALFSKEHDDNYLSCMRYIDWKRGVPYVFHAEDFPELMEVPHLFARKFSTQVDAQIVTMLYEHIKAENSAASEL